MNTLAPIALILFGIRIILSPSFVWEKNDIYMDFTGINWILGPFAIISGIYWIGLNIKVSKRKKKEKKPKSVNNLICPKCKQAYPIEEDKSLKKCPKCQIDMLTLEEFLKYIK